MLAPELVRAGAQARSWACGLAHRDELGVACDIGDIGASERDQSFGRLGARSERRGAGEDVLLQRAFLLVEQRDRESGLVPEAAEQRPLADARGRDDVVEGY